MIDLAGTAPQWGAFLTLLGILGLVWRTHIAGAPARMLAKTEAARAETDEQAILRTYNMEQIKGWRTEVHDVNNRLQTVLLEQGRTQQAADKAASLIRSYEDDRRTMLLLIRLLLAELKSHEPNSPLILHAEMVLAHMIEPGNDPDKSHALNTAEHAVRDAKQTVISATAAVDEVRHGEGAK